MKGTQQSKVQTFLITAFLAFITLVLVGAGLPALLLALRVPSFDIGSHSLWILRWQNNADGSGITVNLVPLLGGAIAVGLLTAFIGYRSTRGHEE